MFKIGELVTASTCSTSVGVVVDIKNRFGVQYCKILWTGEATPHWVSYEQIREHIN